MSQDDSGKDLVRRQFGEHAESYATSPVHAKGASLDRLVELVRPQKNWRVLDIATGAGHTAMAMAPHVHHVIASDITSEMLSVSAKLAQERGLENLSFETVDAETMPYDDGSFDLVTCRIAPHHFQHIDRFVAEAHRVLNAGGMLAVVDNVVPDGQAGEYANRFEKARDPSHSRALTIAEWQAVFSAAGFLLKHTEEAAKRMAFDPWVRRMGASDDLIGAVREMLVNAPPQAADFFCVEEENDELWFYLTEAIIIGSRD